MVQEKTLSADEVFGRVAGLTQALLEDGASASQVAFALTSVAADMGLQVTGDPLKIFPVLLTAIAEAAKTRLQAAHASSDLIDQASPDGATIH